MPADIDAAKLKSFQPFDQMKGNHLADVLKQGTIVSLPEGKMLFKRGEADDNSYWLIEGALDLLDSQFQVTKLTADDTGNKAAFATESPHTVTAVSTDTTRVLRIKSSVLKLIVDLAASDNYMVKGVNEVQEAESDWMSSLLSSPLFDFVPPANIQELFTRFEEKSYSAGDIVIKQGDQGDYFYVIASGRCKVEHETGDRAIKLAEPGPGSFFGEDALVSAVPRNATITMLTDGQLMRLSADDFHSLLQAPLLEKLSSDEARDMMAESEPKTYLLDVRSSKEFQEDKIPGAINLPLMSIRKNLHKLKEEAVYIACCKGDKRGELAAYILNGSGFTAYVLDES